MVREIHKHANQFSILALLFVASMILLVTFDYSRVVIQWTIGLLALSYVGWGVSHHLIKRDLTGYIVLEYVLVAAIAVILLEATLSSR